MPPLLPRIRVVNQKLKFNIMLGRRMGTLTLAADEEKNGRIRESKGVVEGPAGASGGYFGDFEAGIQSKGGDVERGAS